MLFRFSELSGIRDRDSLCDKMQMGRHSVRLDDEMVDEIMNWCKYYNTNLRDSWARAIRFSNFIRMATEFFLEHCGADKLSMAENETEE